MHPFERLTVWQRSHALTVRVYAIAAGWRDFALRDQLRRAAVSIEANIAEGAGGLTQAQFARFVGIALASSAEVRCLLLLSRDVGFLSVEDFAPLDRDLDSVRRMLVSLHQRLRANAARE